MLGIELQQALARHPRPWVGQGHGAIAQAEDAAEVGQRSLHLVHGHQHRDAALAGFLRQGLDDLLRRVGSSAESGSSTSQQARW